MCGIVGVFNVASRDESERLLAQMNGQIVHRGPDDQGVWIGDRAAVGMRRLSIIDVAGGHQPMMTDDGVVIVFNGEIYNYRTLQAQLERDGYRFRTRSDTEVILNLYHRGGLSALEALEGMFAICLVDGRKGKAYLVRDRLGIKPLYFAESLGRLYFASEIKAILAALPQRPEVDTQSLHDYLALRYVPAPGTIWRGIRKLLPGHHLSYDLRSNEWEVERYWSIRFNADPVDRRRDYEREFRDRFLAAVESHLVTSDVPVGTLLSGGIDSSAVTAAIAELGVRGLNTFSVAFEEGGSFSELQFARAAAQQIGAQHHEVIIGRREFIEFLPQFVWYTDEPLADLASIPLYYVARLAKQHVKVVISGEGADEILAGYDFERYAQRVDRHARLLRRAPRWAFRIASAFANGQRGESLHRMSEEGWSGFVRAQRLSATSYWRGQQLAELWRGPPARPVEGLIERWYDDGSSTHPLDMLQNAWCQDWLVEDLLMKADKMTMANSIELRVPYLTHSLVEWAQRLPLSWRVGDARSGYSSKRILRSFAGGRLPSQIIKRPKQGFPVPAYRWLAGELGEWAAQRLADERSPIYGWLAREPAMASVAAARAGDDDAAHRTWALLVLDYWMRRWL
ncbi:MAG: asparagine synthase (glutamine-hydrolyzing) [Pseudomonadota bacterium]